MSADAPAHGRLRFVLVAVEADEGAFVRHALPAGVTDAASALCDEPRPAEGWRTSGFTSIPELIGCPLCQRMARARATEAPAGGPGLL
jgi:hypothetical protein